jgi:hypothetical protein
VLLCWFVGVVEFVLNSCVKSQGKKIDSQFHLQFGGLSWTFRFVGTIFGFRRVTYGHEEAESHVWTGIKLWPIPRLYKLWSQFQAHCRALESFCGFAWQDLIS